MRIKHKENSEQNILNVIMYHYTRDLTHSRYPKIKGLNIEFFRQQIKFLKDNFNIVRMEDVILAIENKKKLPNNAVLLTFDDGYLDNYTYALPILNDFGVQGSFFIPGKTFDIHKLLDVNKIHYILASAKIELIFHELLRRLDFYRGSEYDFPDNNELFQRYAIENRFDSKEIIFIKRMLQTILPEKLRNIISSELFEKFVDVSEEKLAYELYMTDGQIRELKRQGMHIGIHGYDHYWLGNLSTHQMKEDILKSLDIMDPYIDKNNWAISYPYGSYNSEVLSFVESQGACIGFTTNVSSINLQNDNRLLLPRLDCNDYPPISKNYLNY